MHGQWEGAYSGTNTGTLVLELDDRGDWYQGHAYAIESEAQRPSTIALIELPKGKTKFSSKISLQPIDQSTGNILSKEEYERKYPGFYHSVSANVSWDIEPDKICIDWTTDIGSLGSAVVTRSNARQPSQLQAISVATNWDEFKKYALDLPIYKFVFRGQEKNTWRLRTSFHRTKRASIVNFVTADLMQLHRVLSGQTSHRFDLANNLDYAAFLNLIQHHGYPTPLLDWTMSPFIAAYFAYNDLRDGNYASDQKVRILIFDATRWNATQPRSIFINPGYRHLSILEPLAINNSRVVPQQSVSTVTNVEDLEGFIISKANGAPYLHAIDLPVSERKTIMRELDLMGINAGSLFPGLDGACKQMKERFFDLLLGG